MEQPNITQLAANVSNAAMAYSDAPDLKGVQSRTAIRAAARQLLMATMTPDELCWEEVLHMTEIVAMRLCMNLGIFAAIPETSSISATELAKAVNATVTLVERPCRILVAVGFLDQVNPDGGDYRHTKFSLAWRNTNAPGPGTFFQAMYDVYLRPTVPVWEYIESRKTNGLYSDPDTNWDSPVAAVYGRKGEKQGSWDALANYPEITRTFALSLGAVDAIIPPTGMFDFNQLHDDTDRIQLVDVGGGYGKVLSQILDGYPQLEPKKCVLQDIEGVIALAGDARERGVTTLVTDFHADQPIKGARAYFMRYITHDYSDPEATNILSQVAKVMSPDSRLLIADSVIPERLVEGTMLAGVLDQLMFCIGGRERTEAGFRAILEPNNLELITIHRSPTGGAIVEAGLKQK